MAVTVRVADATDISYATTLSSWYKKSAAERGTGISVRSPKYITEKMKNGQAIIAHTPYTLIGFCYIETFDQKAYVSNSGLIIGNFYRALGFGKKIKKAAFELARFKYPEAKIFGITTSEVVMKINTALGYIPVPLGKLTRDEVFWKGCSSCPNYNILIKNDKNMCLCTAMLYEKQES